MFIDNVVFEGAAPLVGQPVRRHKRSSATSIAIRVLNNALPHIRVLQVIEATLGGTRRYMEGVAEALGHGECHGLVYSLHRADAGFFALLDALRRQGWHLFNIDMRREINPFHDVKSALALRSIYETFKPDVVHAHSSKAGALARIATVGMKRRPSVVYTPHSIAANMSWVYELLERLMAVRADIISAVTESERRELHHLNLLPRDRIHLVAPNVSTNRFSPMDQKAARNALGLNDGPIVVAIGRLTSQKDPLAFVEIVATLREIVPELKAIWVGDGELREHVQQRIISLDLESLFTITGWLDDVRPFLAAADVFVSTSRYESFGYVAAEAFAMGRPIVASQVTGTIDIVTSNVNDQLFPPYDIHGAAVRIARILGDPTFAADIAQRGRAHVKLAFSLDETRRALRAVYDSARALRA